MSIHWKSTVHKAKCSAGARPANDKLMPSRNSQSTSTLTATQSSPTAEMVRIIRGKIVLQLSAWTQDSGIFPEPSKDLAPEASTSADLYHKHVLFPDLEQQSG